MSKYQKKPVVIEAVQNSTVLGMINDPIPEWFKAGLRDGTITEADEGAWAIKTLEGTMIANRGDWIIRGVKGELYPCKPDIFDATYEAVE
jgi:hypothetical protein